MGAEQIRKLKAEALEPKAKKYYTIAKVSKKKAAKQETDKEILKLDDELRKTVWNASKHECQNCGIHLGNAWKKWNFHHLLPKAQYPELRHVPENIMVLCLECHSKCETNIDFAPKIRLRTIEAERILLNQITGTL